MEFNHKSVLFDETIEALAIKSDGVVEGGTGEMKKQEEREQAKK